jgi:heme/copper-type cytochrome/quinol oxidase subunit 2
MLSEAIGLTITTVGCMILSFFAPEIMETVTDAEPNELLDFIYKMTSLMVPVFVALVWTRRKKRKDKEDQEPK